MIHLTSLSIIFADDISLFSKVHDIDKSAKEFNSDLEKIVDGLFNGKWNLIGDVFRSLGRPVYRFGHPRSGVQKPLFKFPSSSWISTKKMRWSSNKWFHNASICFKMAYAAKTQTEEKNNERKRLKRKK